MSTDLPMPNFIERDAEAIERRMIQRWEEETNKRLHPGQPEALLIAQIAYEVNLVRIGVQDAALLNLVDFSRYPVLDWIGNRLDVQRLDEQPARTTLRFELSALRQQSVLVPQDTRVRASDGEIVFKTIAPLVIPAGQRVGEVDALADPPGIDGNGYLPGEVSELLDAVAYIAEVSNLTVSAGGSERESDEAYRQRIKEAPTRFSLAGPRGAYIFHAKGAHPDIVDVDIITNYDAVVQVYVLAKNGEPSPEILAAVEEALDPDTVIPDSDKREVYAAIEVDFSLVANVTLFDDADASIVDAALDAAVAAYRDEMRSVLGRDIVKRQIYRLIMDVNGVYDVDLTLKNGNDQTFDVRVLERSEWANLVSYEVNITGTAEG